MGGALILGGKMIDAAKVIDGAAISATTTGTVNGTVTVPNINVNPVGGSFSLVPVGQ